MTENCECSPLKCICFKSKFGMSIPNQIEWHLFKYGTMITWSFVYAIWGVFILPGSNLEYCFCSVWHLSVLRGHLVFSSSPEWPMTSEFEGFLYHIFSITLFSYLNSWERASIPFSIFSAKQGNCWYYFYNVFGMTRSLTGDWTRDLPHSVVIEKRNHRNI